jgi:hypothetical protein
MSVKEFVYLIQNHADLYKLKFNFLTKYHSFFLTIRMFSSKRLYLTNIKHFLCWDTVISTRVEIGKTRKKFSVLTLSYINTALSQSAFRIYKCYIINVNSTYKLACKNFISYKKLYLLFSFRHAMFVARPCTVKKFKVNEQESWRHFCQGNMMFWCALASWVGVWTYVVSNRYVWSQSTGIKFSMDTPHY